MTAPELDRLLEELDRLEETVDDPEERRRVARTIAIAQRMPARDRIRKYTTRDVAEAFLGGTLFAMPLMFEDGIFEIARYLLRYRIADVPVFLLANVLFMLVGTVGLIYWTDVRDIEPHRPLFGIVPRRLAGVLLVSLIAVIALMVLWGRLFIGAPTASEAAARVSVVWTVAAFGATLGDIIPGESEGYDIVIENLDDIVKPG